MNVETNVDLSVRVGGLTLRNPVMPASGTFAEGLERVMDFNRLGAIVTKTITRELRDGNPLPRVVERPGSLINAIGIPSKGVPDFIKNTMAHYAPYDTPLIVSISAPTADGFASLARELTLPGVAAIEANISCPNIEEDGKAFAMRAETTEKVTRELRTATSLPLWVKLTPNTGDIQICGALFLCYLGISTFFGKASDTDNKEVGLANSRAFLSTFFLTLTNPMTIISFAGVYAGLGIGHENSSVDHALITTLGVFLGSIVWWFILSLIASIFRDKFTSQSSIWLNKISGSILFGFGSFALIA